MIPVQDSEGFRRNIQGLGLLDPVLAREIEAAAPSTRLVMDHSGAANLDLGGGVLMYPGGPDAVRAQVEAFLADPQRLIINPGRGCAEMIVMNRLLDAMKLGQDAFPRAADFAPFGGYLIVLGLGLGYHLDRLVERVPFKTLIIVEPHVEFWHHSCHVIDWTGLQERLRLQGREIRVVREKAVFPQVVKIVRDHGTALLSGSHVYFHYQTPEFVEFAAKLANRWQDLAMISGWVEDQLTMLRNNAANFARPGFHVQTARLGSRRGLPAIVVGAGPSLDDAIEDIRALRDRAVVITASSALRVLLEHGIRPDIHCELENGAGLAPVAAGLAAKHGGLSDIALYAAAVVDPGIAPHFGDVAYFFRNRLSSTLLFADGAEATLVAEPTSGNTAIHCALSLGFQEIYLFGLDFGARDPEAHHSSHSVYFNAETEAELATYTPYEFDQTVPGNFGGQVKSGWLLNWGREAITLAIQQTPGIRVKNCSDGALIPGTWPLSPEGIDLAPPSLEPRRDVTEAFAQLAFLPEGRADVANRLAELHQTCRDFLADVLAAVAAVDPNTRQHPQAEVIRLWQTIQADPRFVKDSPVFSTFLGHLEGGIGAAYVYASTLRPEDAAEGLAALKRSLTASLNEVLALVDEGFREI